MTPHPVRDDHRYAVEPPWSLRWRKSRHSLAGARAACVEAISLEVRQQPDSSIVDVHGRILIRSAPAHSNGAPASRSPRTPVAGASTGSGSGWTRGSRDESGGAGFGEITAHEADESPLDADLENIEALPGFETTEGITPDAPHLDTAPRPDAIGPFSGRNDPIVMMANTSDSMRNGIRNLLNDPRVAANPQMRRTLTEQLRTYEAEAGASAQQWDRAQVVRSVARGDHAIVDGWIRESNLVGRSRSAQLEVVDQALAVWVSGGRLDQHDLDRGEGEIAEVLSAIAAWHASKSNAVKAGRGAAITRLERQLHAERDERRRVNLDRAISTLRQEWNPQGIDASGHPDPFAVREAPRAPDFLRPGGRRYPYHRLAPDQVAAFLRNLDSAARRPDARTLDPRYLPHDPRAVTVSSDGMRQVPHVSSSIWFGGPLYNDGPNGFRSQFMRNLADGAARNPGFAFVLWTDVPRLEVEAAAARLTRWSAPQASVRGRRVEDMLRWAQSNRIHLVDYREVFNRDNTPSMGPYILTELARNAGEAYAGASDMARLEILALLRGLYTDGDNIIRDLRGIVRAVAERPDGLALGRAAGPRPANEPAGHDSRKLNNAVLVAAHGAPGIEIYRDLVRGNVALGYAQLLKAVFPNLADVPLDAINQHITRFPRLHTPQIEVVQRSGPNKRTYTLLAEALGYGNSAQLGAVPPEAVTVEAAGSWNSSFTVADAIVDSDVLSSAVRAAVVGLHAVHRARGGGVHLEPVEPALKKVPTELRPTVWDAALHLFRDSLAATRTPLRWISTARSDLPSEVADSIRGVFPSVPHLDAVPRPDADIGWGSGRSNPIVMRADTSDSMRNGIRNLLDDPRIAANARMTRILTEQLRTFETGSTTAPRSLSGTARKSSPHVDIDSRGVGWASSQHSALNIDGELIPKGQRSCVEVAVIPLHAVHGQALGQDALFGRR
jgi:hypothetical protein